jgi:hypothetical protein
LLHDDTRAIRREDHQRNGIENLLVANGHASKIDRRTGGAPIRRS